MLKRRFKLKILRRLRRKKRVRKKVYGTAERPRLSVYRSNRHIYAQIINDDEGRTLVACSTLSREIKEKYPDRHTYCTKEFARMVGELLAKKALEKGIKKVVFDRNGYKYHGRIKELADAARKAGLEF